MSNFLRRTPCAALRAGHRTLPPINQRPWPKRRSGIRQKRRSAPRGNSRRRPGDGVGGVGEAAGSWGASPSLLARGPLGAHTIERPSPLLPLWNRPCRVQGGDRVPTGLPEGARVPSRRRFSVGESGDPETQPVRRRRIGTQVATGSPEAAWDPGHRGLRPEVIWIRTTVGLPEVERDPDSNESFTPRGNSRRRPDDGDGGRRRSWPDEVGVITPSTRRPLGAHTTR